MRDLFIYGILIFLIVLGFGFAISKIDTSSDYIYECTNYKGDIIYCKYVKSYYGTMSGYKEDGTTVQITSYKKIYDNPELLEKEANK